MANFQSFNFEEIVSGDFTASPVNTIPTFTGGNTANAVTPDRKSQGSRSSMYNKHLDSLQVVTSDSTCSRTLTYSIPKSTCEASPSLHLVSEPASTMLRALTPKLVVKLSTHEEVTSRVRMALDEVDSTAEISVEGTVFVSACTSVGILFDLSGLLKRFPRQNRFKSKAQIPATLRHSLWR